MHNRENNNTFHADYSRYQSYVRLISTINNGVADFAAGYARLSDIVGECDLEFRSHLARRDIYSRYESFESKLDVETIAQSYLCDSMAELMWLFNAHHEPHNTTLPFINSTNQCRVILMPRGEDYSRSSIVKSYPSIEHFLSAAPRMLARDREYSGLVYSVLHMDTVDFEEIGTSQVCWKGNSIQYEGTGISKRTCVIGASKMEEYSIQRKIATNIKPQS